MIYVNFGRNDTHLNMFGLGLNGYQIYLRLEGVARNQQRFVIGGNQSRRNAAGVNHPMDFICFVDSLMKSGDLI